MPTDQTLPVQTTSGTQPTPTNNDFDISLNLESTPAQELTLDFSDITNIENPKPAEPVVEINPNNEAQKREDPQGTEVIQTPQAETSSTQTDTTINTATTTDDRLKTEDQLVQQTLEPTPIETTWEQQVEQAKPTEPVVAETKPNLVDFFVTTEDIVKPEESIAQPVEQTIVTEPVIENSYPITTTESTTTNAFEIESTPVETMAEQPVVQTTEITETPATVQTPVAEEPQRPLFQSSYEESTKIETPVVQTQPVEDLNQIATSVTQTPVEVVQTANMPEGDFKKDEQIISQIQSIAGQQPQAPIITQEQTPATPSTGVNLDDILGTPSTTPTPTVETPGITTNPITNQPLPPQTILPAFNSTGNYILPTTNLQQVQSVLTTGTNNKKLLINIGIWVGIFVVWIFIFKTMYPLQYQSMIGKQTTQTSNTLDTISNNINTTDTGTTTEETNSGTDTATDQDATDNLAGIDTPTTHGAATQQSGFDAFQDINQVMGTGIDTEKTKTQLQSYIDQGKKNRVTAKKSNNKDALKYSLFLWKKAEKLLQDIDNESGITTDEINQQMDQFSGSLQKLKSAIDGQQTSEQATQQVIPTPADFFGTASGDQTTIQSGTTQKENSGTKTPAISGEQAFFQ